MPTSDLLDTGLPGLLAHDRPIHRTPIQTWLVASRAALGADVVVAAQAAEIQATVVTNNPGQIGRWVPVHTWP
jgi:hypothetical protein